MKNKRKNHLKLLMGGKNGLKLEPDGLPLWDGKVRTWEHIGLLMEEFNKKLDSLAQRAGYKDCNDWMDNSPHSQWKRSK